MRSAILLSLGVALLAVNSSLAGDKAPKDVPKPSKESYVKIRVEVEFRGMLQDNEKGMTVVAQDRVYNIFHPNEENADWTRPVVYTLDFARAKDLRERAKVLNGKEVIVTGTCEVRRYVQKLSGPVGGQGYSGPIPFPMIHLVPNWILQQTVEVTGLTSAGNK